MKKLIGILFIIAAIACGYYGYTKLEESRVGLKIGNISLSAQDDNTKRDAYILFGVAVVGLILGYGLLKSRE